MSLESSFSPLEDGPFVRAVAPELVFPDERIMQSRLTALEEAAHPNNSERSLAAFAIVKTIMEDPEDPIKVPDDPNDYLEDDVIIAIDDFSGDLSRQEGAPRETFLVTRFMEPLVEREITDATGKRIAAVLPAEWSDIVMAYRQISLLADETQFGFSEQQAEARVIACAHLNRFITTLHAIPAFRRAIVDYMAPEPYFGQLDHSTEVGYSRRFWLGLASRPYLYINNEAAIGSSHEMVADRKDALIFPAGDQLVEVTYRRAPLHISGLNTDILSSAETLEVTLLPSPGDDSPVRRAVISTATNSSDCGVRYAEYDHMGNEIKVLAATTSQKARDTYDPTEQAITELRWAIARSAKPAA